MPQILKAGDGVGVKSQQLTNQFEKGKGASTLPISLPTSGFIMAITVILVWAKNLNKKSGETKILKWLVNIQLLALVMLASIDELAKRFFRHSDVFITAFYLLTGIAFVAGVIIRRQKNC